MTCYRAFQVDAFTRERFTGNPAGVVLDADGLDDRQMQAIAREFNNSETAFLLKPDSDDHAVRIRYFTPTQEVPSCGHATIAAHFVRARLLGLGSTRVWHKIGIGVLPVDIEAQDDGHRVIMTQGRPEIAPPVDGAIVIALSDALGLSLGELDPDCPVQWVNTGNSKLIVGVKNREILNRLRPDDSALIEIANKIGNAGVFVFTRDTMDESLTAHARMFAPNIGISEDPVTGNGNGPLGAYLVHRGMIPVTGDEVYLRTSQGEAMGRPGEAHIWVTVKDGAPETVRVGGDCVIAFETEIEV